MYKQGIFRGVLASGRPEPRVCFLRGKCRDMADEKVWKPLELIKVTAEYFAAKNVPSPRLDAEVLLCDVLGLRRRVDLYAGFETEVSGKNLAAYREFVRRRALREPVSRILGRREFMGIPFLVTPDVLSPRPETELLVEAVLECVQPKKNTLPPDEEEEPAAETPVDDSADSALLDQLLDSYGEDLEDEKHIDDAPAAVLKTPAARSARRGPEYRASKSCRAASGSRSAW